MKVTYAIGDLHGRIDVLEAALVEIEQHRLPRDKTGSDTTIVFLGDYIDRGKQSRQVVERLMAGPSDKAKWITLTGNHEDMCLSAHASPNQFWRWWTENGGLATMMSYDGNIPEEHLAWMRSLPDRHIDRHRLFVHAGVARGLPYSAQTKQHLIWVRYHKTEEVGLGKHYVVHGHTPFMDGPVILETRCNLDTKSYATGRATVAVFDDSLPGKPIELLDVRVGYSPSWD
jgi:serine/threonine protein phosphatase 1